MKIKKIITIAVIVVVGGIVFIMGIGLFFGDDESTSSYAADSSSKEYDLSINSIQWTDDLEYAMSVAAASGKPIMLDLYTDWCTYCKLLDSESFVDRDVIRESTLFVPVKMDTEKNRLGRHVVDTYGVTGYPVILFIDAEGRLISKMTGYLPADGVLFYMEEAYNKFYN